MNRREAKIKALDIAWQLINAWDFQGDPEDGSYDDWTEDDYAKVARELDTLSQSLFNRMARLEEHGR